MLNARSEVCVDNQPVAFHTNVLLSSERTTRLQPMNDQDLREGYKYLVLVAWYCRGSGLFTTFFVFNLIFLAGVVEKRCRTCKIPKFQKMSFR